MLTNRDLEFIFGNKFGEKVNRYPLTNISVDDEETIIVEIAVAGFDKSEIEVEEIDNYILVKGSKDAEPSDVEYIQKHISTDSFERKIILNEKYIGSESEVYLKNGLLTIIIKPIKKEKKKLRIL